MLPLDDPRWGKLTAGYRTPYDPSPALHQLEKGQDVWDELWQELHHQGDVGEASYAAVPQLVRIGTLLPRRDWNLYGLVSTIEIERHRRSNPPMPAWLVKEYKQAMQDLVELAVTDLHCVTDRDTIRSILGVIALAKCSLRMGALISHSDDSEIEEYLEQYAAWSESYTERPLT